ncbi:ABC transporter permease [Paenibacillus alvei]|uniref:Multi-copper enzyme maturation ABC transporter permease n=1 Tax=Paenibacillus alvei TaxID=44250 RepID=A0A383RKH6_PAEAL|nr:ABC transporter permease [Paenibacillus alvei]SYX87518.1 Multi-copper enzyme maturation ABC transporter permease [Paenibacillus alvei]
MKHIGSIAKQEMKLIIRSRWLASFSILFTLLALFIVFFGNDGYQAGYEGFTRMTAGLLNLSLFLVPLLTLLMGSTMLAGDKEDGGYQLLLTYPVSPTSIVLGKYIGMLAAIAAVILLGYGIVETVLWITNRTGIFAASLFFLFIALTLLLAAVFLAIASVIGVYASTRFQALGISILTWALSVLLYEYIVMGVSSVVPFHWIITLLTTSILFNPVELIRVWSIVQMKSGMIFGPTLYDFTIWAEGSTGQIAFCLTAAAWIIAPLALSIIIVKQGVRIHE